MRSVRGLIMVVIMQDRMDAINDTNDRFKEIQP